MESARLSHAPAPRLRRLASQAHRGPLAAAAFPHMILSLEQQGSDPPLHQRVGSAEPSKPPTNNDDPLGAHLPGSLLTNLYSPIARTRARPGQRGTP